jgi:hypothetical protein
MLKTRPHYALTASIVIGIGSLAACGDAGESPAAASPAAPPPTEAAHEDHAATDHAATEPEGATVSVAQDGTRFDPAVTPAEIPVGAWLCDMNGAVHYASLSRGDGTCPICNMDLTQQTEASRHQHMGGQHMGGQHMGGQHMDGQMPHGEHDRMQHGEGHGDHAE